MSGTPPPLADRLRPKDAAGIVGQEKVLRPGGLLDTALATGDVPSLVLWGPPGSGKTTLARLLAERGGHHFELLSAVTSGVKEVREVIAEAKARRVDGKRTLLFVDEIHRFNRAQQDAFLPHVEDGTITLIGATTENPGFSLVGALLSRLRVVVLEPLPPAALEALIDRALAAPEGIGPGVSVPPAARRALVEVAGGDARRLLNALESAAALARALGGGEIDAALVAEAAQAAVVAYDRSGDDRYDLLSAFHKSLRGSDADAALFWMARMLEAGEDPLVVCRRMVAMASEDVGLAEPRALGLALDAWRAVETLGVPEGRLALTEACLFLAAAPKSNTVLRALGAATEAARAHPDLPVPLHLRNAPTGLARRLGHGKGYVYPHDHPHAVTGQTYLPEALKDTRFVDPREIGEEREFAKRLAWWRSVRSQAPPSTGFRPDD